MTEGGRGLLEFLSRLFKREKESSKEIATERLRLVLVHDRAGVKPQLLEELKTDLIKVISDYMEIDEDGLEVSLDSKDNTVALIANIPIKRMKRTVKNLA